MSDPTSFGSTVPGRGSATILLVDDEVDILPEYEEFLELAGFTALTESDPEQALRIVSERADIGVVVTDLKMAKLDGASLIRSLRDSLPAQRQVQFIILTGDATLLSRSQGCDAPVLLKPVDFDELIEALDRALASRQ